jgi:hypothetical protein
MKFMDRNKQNGAMSKYLGLMPELAFFEEGEHEIALEVEPQLNEAKLEARKIEK